MKFLKLFLLFGIGLHAISFSQTHTLYVYDAKKKTPLENAHIMHKQKMIGYTKADGSVEINHEIEEVMIHLLGYLETTFSISQSADTAFVVPSVYQMDDDIVVYAHGNQPDINNYKNSSAHLTLDQMLDNVDGVSMIQRGAFAWEPMIRGQDDQRINLMIDGMQVFKACVDKMDPVTSYVESDNLSKLIIDKSGSGVAENGNGNSTINLITKKPDFESFKLNVSTGVRYPDFYRVISTTSEVSSEQHSFRFSGSIKQADDFVAGGDSNISNSGFGKVNLNLAYRYRAGSGNTLDISYIFDDARDVGYPALLMDATRALANMLRVQYNWNEPGTNVSNTSLLIYANTIDHEMDDYERDVANRAVMRNMYMPMAGITKTAGAKLSRNLSIAEQPVSLFVDGYISKAFGDMMMISLFDIEDMYITNLGDIYTGSTRVGAKTNFLFSENVLLKLEESLEFNRVELTDKSSKSFFEGSYGKEVQPRARFLFSSSAHLTWLLNDRLSLSTKGIFSQRQANYIELYGHYIYNYVDGFFYDGNPFLKPETTLNSEINAQYQIAENAFSVSAYYKQIYNYISGMIDEDISNQFYQFKRYDNVGDAYLTGFEVRWLSNWTRSLTTDIRTAYTYAQNKTLDEPLPLIPPVHGSFLTSYSANTFSVSTTLEWAAQQQRIAEQTSIEDQTSGFAILNFEAGKTWGNKLETRLTINNILDQYYNQHTSIGNIPESGRSFMITLSYSL